MEYKTLNYNIKRINHKEILAKSKQFYNLIKKRRTIRDFDKKIIDDEIIKNAILAAGSSPSGANLQPWHFVIIKDNKIKKKIRKAAEIEEKKFYNSHFGNIGRKIYQLIRLNENLIIILDLSGFSFKIDQGAAFCKYSFPVTHILRSALQDFLISIFCIRSFKHL